MGESSSTHIFIFKEILLIATRSLPPVKGEEDIRNLWITTRDNAARTTGWDERDWSGEVCRHCTREMLCQILPWSLCFWEKVLKKKVQQQWFIFQDSKPVSLPETSPQHRNVRASMGDLSQGPWLIWGAPDAPLPPSMFGSYLTKAICGQVPQQQVWCVGHQVAFLSQDFHFFHLCSHIVWLEYHSGPRWEVLHNHLGRRWVSAPAKSESGGNRLCLCLPLQC